MTREEALYRVKGYLTDIIPAEDYSEVEEIIKALDQQPVTTTNNDEPITIIYPTTVCDDAISREDALKVASKECQEFRGIYGRIEDGIQKLPSVTQKAGKWIEHTEIETSAPEYLMFYECSECGNKPCFCKSDIHKKRFCSNCGARMVEPQESEEQTDAT